MSNMSKSDIFDKAMDFIDDRILAIATDCETDGDISDALCQKFKHSNIRFTSFIAALTNGQMTLNKYISRRKLYFAVLELKNSDTPIAAIAVKYYADQSGFTKAIGNAYGLTPTEIRETKPSIPDNRLHLSGLVEQSSILSKIINKIEKLNRPIGDYESDLFMVYVRASEEYGFDTETICLIADLAKRLDLSFAFLLEKIYEIDLFAEQEYGYCMPESEVSLSLGIASSDDAYAITEYYHVKSVYRKEIYYATRPEWVLVWESSQHT